jgi:ATP-dependent Clp protease ATP-binding subunit ClpC
MTTNLGSADLARGISVGFSDDSDQESSYEHMKAKVREDLKKNFRPEFLNRLDDIIVFPQLTRDEILQIVELMIGKLAERLNEKGMQLKLTDAAKQLLADKGYDSVLGARPLRRVITNELEDVLSEKILYDEMKEGDLAVFVVLGKEFKLTVKHKE